MKKLTKVYVIKKYITATSARHAIRLDKKHEVDDVWVDEERTKELKNTAIGFNNKSPF